MREALAIRTRVFVGEQGVPPEEEVDAHDRSDPQAVHALVREHGRIRAARGAGAGRALLTALVAEARRRGFRRAHLHAQTHARGFYAKAGFHDDGEPLWDAGILHQPMSLELG
jgi:predicted GNAT family N-acyltransferase